MNPKLVLLDEVTSALDPEPAQEALATVKSLADEGTALLILTREMRFARNVSHHVVFIEEGQIAEQGSLSQIFDSPASQRLADFLGSARL
jgi:ABC-type histidine transport system ATPase subunit